MTTVIFMEEFFLMKLTAIIFPYEKPFAFLIKTVKYISQSNTNNLTWKILFFEAIICYEGIYFNVKTSKIYNGNIMLIHLKDSDSLFLFTINFLQM